MSSINYPLPFEAYFWYCTVPFPQASESVFQLAYSQILLQIYIASNEIITR